ncbi:tRNA-dependent cyclodipeptide synthase [Verminephrobacter aporrectodeae subsp. tuberculatae]|nr:tRNA-dependent cyclodipeptide synthase [Verminephrobacter aporrectodeae subsp. tuberculatae]MCW8202656.1 tRNA-dependent cyclodipeptide synthase [Verminephrobacter aporrectodeae subsp. tuberculatae]
MLHEFEIFGETPRCNEIIALRQHILVGVSPFNPKFSVSYIASLIQWAFRHFTTVDVLLPCEENAARLIEATGSTPKKAQKKTKREIQRHLRTLDFLAEQCSGAGRKFRVIQFSDFATNEFYKKSKAEVITAFNDCSEFRFSCMEMSRKAICGRLRGVGGDIQDISEKRIFTALPYIFAEIPFYINTPLLLGVSHSVLAYHRPWFIGTGLFAGHFPLRVHKNQAYGIVTAKS